VVRQPKRRYKSGAWFSYRGDRLGQGRENSKQLLKKKPELLKHIEREVKVKLGMPMREEKMEPSEGRRQVQVTLHSRDSTEPLKAEDEFEQQLLASGILTEIPPPLTDADIEAFGSYKPIIVKGRPVSETIIEERR
jgi:hypothetical protein